MLLSEAYEKYEYMPSTYACCVMCHKAWVDDMDRYSSLHCPKCGPEVGCMYRGAKDPAQYGCTLDESAHEETVKRAVADAQPKSYSLSSVKSKHV